MLVSAKRAVKIAIKKHEKATLSFLGSLLVPPFQGLGIFGRLPRASLAGSLCPGLFSFGLSALEVSVAAHFWEIVTG